MEHVIRIATMRQLHGNFCVPSIVITSWFGLETVRIADHLSSWVCVIAIHLLLYSLIGP